MYILHLQQGSFYTFVDSHTCHIHGCLLCNLIFSSAGAIFIINFSWICYYLASFLLHVTILTNECWQYLFKQVPWSLFSILKKKSFKIMHPYFCQFWKKKIHRLCTDEADKAQIKMLIQILHGTCNHPKFPATPTHCHTEHYYAHYQS